MDLSVLIVNWNTRDDLLRCLAALYAHPPTGAFEVIVADNASSDGSAAAVAEHFAGARLLALDENVGFARANNRALALARGEALLLLNPDTEVCAGALAALQSHLAAHPRVGAAGPRLNNADGSLQVSVERMPTLFREWWRLLHLDRLHPVSAYPAAYLAGRAPRPVEVLNGACLCVRRAALPEGGLFDEDYFMYSEEVDLCDRLRQAGWALHWVPAAEVVHHGGRSTRQAADAMFLELYRNKVKFFRKRRGRPAAALYKLLLLEAGLLRVVGGHLAARLPLRSRDQWLRIARLYGRLLGALPTL